MTGPHLPRFHVYLLLAGDGTVYTGYTARLLRRFKQHNSPKNEGYTRGKRWRLLATRRFLDADTALLYEKQLKRSRYDKRNWIKRARRVSARYRKLCGQIGIPEKF